MLDVLLSFEFWISVVAAAVIVAMCVAVRRAMRRLLRHRLLSEEIKSKQNIAKTAKGE